MPLIAASVHCLPNVLWHMCILTYCFLSVWGLFKVISPIQSILKLLVKTSPLNNAIRTLQAMNAKSPWERRLCFSPPFMMRMLVLVLRSFGLGGGNPEAFTHVVLQVRLFFSYTKLYKVCLGNIFRTSTNREKCRLF